MDTVIGFLERLGEDAGFSSMPQAAFESIVDQLDVDPVQRDALMKKSAQALVDALDVRKDIYCLIYAPDSQPAKEEEEQEGGKENEEDEREVSSAVN